jgi:P-type conjugative transfer protein TrbJ
MKRSLLAGIAALPLLMAQPTQSEAVIVECDNCSTIAEELVSDAKQAQQYATQLQQYATELQQYANMVQNTVALPMQVFAGVSNDIMQVRNLANMASVLTGNSGSILQRLQMAGSYANQAAMLPNQIGSQFTMWSQTLGNASQSLGKVLGVQQGQQTNYAALQAAIQQHSQTAAGQMQAIQAGNELAALTSTQLNQLQTTLTATAQQIATRDLVTADRQAAQDQAELQFSQYKAAATTGAQGF